MTILTSLAVERSRAHRQFDYAEARTFSRLVQAKMEEARNVPNFSPVIRTATSMITRPAEIDLMSCSAEWNADAMNANAGDERAAAAGRCRTLRGKSRLCQPRGELCRRNPNPDDVRRAPAGENAMPTHLSSTLASRSTSLLGVTRMLRDEVGVRHRRLRRWRRRSRRW
jgi:hypothetical protein